MKPGRVSTTPKERVAQDSVERLGRAEARHRELSAKAEDLRRRGYLSAAEQNELTDVKKQKLRVKDEIALLRGR
jgi:uncharacterized protein YdcH (DUF465 family)